MGSSRDIHFDGLKFLLIFLVVLGHLTFDDYGIGVKRLFYSFHMPVFVFLSGYFTSLSSSKEKQYHWILKTIVIFVIAHVAQCLLRVLIVYISSLINNSAFNISSVLKWSMLTVPGLALWYLVCLVYWRFAIWRIGDKPKDIHLFIISCVAAILAGFIPLNYRFSFQRAFAFFPFFMLGVVFRKRDLLIVLERIPVPYAIVGLVIGVFIASKLPTYLPVHHYETWNDVVIRLAQTVLGLCLCLFVVRVSRCNFTEHFAKYGSKTLWIYIGHTYFIILGDRVFHYIGLSLNLFSALLLAMLYCVFFIILAYQYERLINRRNLIADSRDTKSDSTL